MARIIEKDEVARLDRLEEGVELLVERRLVLDVGDDLDVLLVEAGVFQVLRKVLGVVHRAAERIDVAVGIPLVPDQKGTTRLRFGLRSPQTDCENKKPEQQVERRSDPHVKTPARLSAPVVLLTEIWRQYAATSPVR